MAILWGRAMLKIFRRSCGSYLTSATKTLRIAHRIGNGAAEVGGRRTAAEIGRLRPARSRVEHRLDGADERVVRVAMAEEVEHQRAGPDLPDRIGDAAAGDVGGRAVHRLEQRRML